jgi:hypothetical protein
MSAETCNNGAGCRPIDSPQSCLSGYADDPAAIETMRRQRQKTPGMVAVSGRRAWGASGRLMRSRPATPYDAAMPWRIRRPARWCPMGHSSAEQRALPMTRIDPAGIFRGSPRAPGRARGVLGSVSGAGAGCGATLGPTPGWYHRGGCRMLCSIRSRQPCIYAYFRESLHAA